MPIHVNEITREVIVAAIEAYFLAFQSDAPNGKAGTSELIWVGL